MIVEYPLLDLLAIQMKSEYLSDLLFLPQGQRQYLAQKPHRLTPREEDIQDWNGALQYLTRSPPEKSTQEAQWTLVSALRLQKNFL